MKKKNVKIISSILVVLMLLQICSSVFASSVFDDSVKVEYSEEFQKWLELPEEERNKIIMPMMFEQNGNSQEDINNVFSLTQSYKASYASSYDLRTQIPENMVVKNQGGLGACWAFGALSMLETTLALKDKKEGKTAQEYDFSERHMVYATSREAFLNNAINEKGYSKAVADGGNYYEAVSYLTNGLGAIAEEDMPYTDSSNNIDIQQIQNKNVVTTVNDVEFIKGEAGSTEFINAIKSHIMNYGGVNVSIKGDPLFGDDAIYNNVTGAIYSPTKEANHSVTLIGWDDTYATSNFNSQNIPPRAGAFIVKNSWGSKVEFTKMSDIDKSKVYNLDTAYFNAKGITSASQITDNDVISFLADTMYGEGKVTLENGTIYTILGDNGFMYISYADPNLDSACILKNVENYKDYENIYQHEYMGATNVDGYMVDKIYLAVVFNNKSTDEKVTKVGINSSVNVEKCKVYINPNNSSKEKANLQLVELKEGAYESLKNGFNTIEFANPIKLNGSSFVIVLEIENMNNELDNRYNVFPILQQLPSVFKPVTPVAGTGFIGALSNNEYQWVDVSTKNYILPIKAYTTTSNVSEKALTGIQITTPPTKTTYNVGDAFDKSGMVVKANYSDGTSQNVTNFTVTNGTSLAAGQTSVTVSYTESGVTKTTTQAITVNGTAPTTKTLTGIQITTPPTKTTYNAGENFDATGMVVRANYSDNTNKNVTNYTVLDGANLTKGKTSVTISYTEGGITKTAQQTITVNEATQPQTKTLSSIQVKTEPTKKVYVEGENFDNSGMVIQANYSDSSNKVVTDYTVTDGTSLSKGKTSVTISYTESGVTKTTTQAITVNEKEKESPTPSDFSNAGAKISKATSYTYVAKTDKEDYTVIEVDLSGVKIGDGKSTRKFYYYLSTKKGETNIDSSNWTEFELDGSSTTITIDSRNLSYADELVNGNNLFLYVKEISTLNGESAEVVSTVSLTNDTELILYVDDVKKDGANTSNGGTATTGDDTTAGGKIPQTGVTIIAGVVVVIAIAGVAAVSYYRYKNIIR